MADSRAHEFVVVADHLPVDHTLPVGHALSGGVRPEWRSTRSGLNTALQPIVAERGGAWVGWSGLVDTPVGPFPWDRMWLHPVQLSAREVSYHIDGQCNATIAPLYHDAVEPPVFHRHWRHEYHLVNERYAQTAAAVAAPGGIVWVHDYHLQLVPAMLRALRPDLLIGFFLHIPFPPIELFMQLPLRGDIVHGLLGADLIGFQRAGAAENFLHLARHVGGHRTDGRAVIVDDRRVVVEAFPLSVDFDTTARLAQTPAVRERAADIRTELGSPRTVLLAVDRLDPSKGIEQRLSAYAELLAGRALDPADTVLVQVAVPSRQRTPHHSELRDRVERRVGQINGVHAQVGRPAVHYLHQSFDYDELTALYLAADVMLATPLRDGMNLNAKEFVACRTDGSGALVLSEFTGAAADLPQATIVNPHDVDALKSAILAAVRPEPAPVRRAAMRAMREQVRRYDVHHWAERFLQTLHRCEEGEATESDEPSTLSAPRRFSP